MRGRFAVFLGIVGFLLGALATSVSATVITIDASKRGWNANTGVLLQWPDANYLVGNCGSGSGSCHTGEYRNWFEFEIPALSGPIASARLVLDSASVDLDQGPSMTYSVTSLPAVFGFAQMGTGTLYGFRAYSSVDTSTTQFIDLNAAGLADLIASELADFRVGGRISEGAIFGAEIANQLAFGGSQGDFSTQLEITIVPELNTVALMGLGLAGLGLRRRTKHSALKNSA